MTIRTGWRRAIMAVAAGAGLVLAATPAAAAPTAKPYCAVLDSKEGDIACYSTEAGVLNHGSGAWRYHLITIYADLNYDTRAPHMKLYFPRVCFSDPEIGIGMARLDFDWPDAGYGVNNKISSLQTYYNCNVQLFDYYDPTRLDNPHSMWIDHSGNLNSVPGVWGNRASSFVLANRL